MFRISFCDLLKILIMIIFKFLEKLCHVNFFKFDKKNGIIKKKRKTSPSAFQKNALHDVFGFLIIYVFLSNLKKLTSVLLFKDFFEKHNFPESVLCYCKIFYFTTFGPDIGVCIVHVVIFIKKYLVNLLRISFFELSKSTTIIFLNFS